jgi:5-methylcytosine-specific restriction endonuclease McrA
MSKLSLKGRSRKSGMADGLIRARRRHARIEQVNRRRIIARDNSTCYLCGRKVGYTEVVIDHVIPLSRGGSHSEENMKVACPGCNSRKGMRLLAECDWLNQSDGTLTIKAFS